jgi:RIO-like serine/threonine protein kinase
MKLENETDHMAILALMISGLLLRRLNELGQIDEVTANHLHQLVAGVRRHAAISDLGDLNVLFDNIDRSLGSREQAAVA